jgi:hypothetical protein
MSAIFYNEAAVNFLGETMANLADALGQLREERKHAQEQVTKLDRVISAIAGLMGRAGNSDRPKRSMSAAARKRISQAQKARWANLRKQSKPILVRKAGTTPPKRTVSLAARRKIAAAQRARWANVRARQAKKAA